MILCYFIPKDEKSIEIKEKTVGILCKQYCVTSLAEDKPTNLRGFLSKCNYTILESFPSGGERLLCYTIIYIQQWQDLLHAKLVCMS